MTNRRRRAALAAAALNRQRARRVEVPAAGEPDRLLPVARSVLEVSEQFGFGAPLGEEYAVVGWQAAVADRAQDFEGGTIYLDTATGDAWFWRWRAYNPITSTPRDRTVENAPGGKPHSTEQDVPSW